MYTVRVYLKNLDDGREFVKLAEGFTGDVDLTEGNISIDGKSIIGASMLPYPCEMNAVLHDDSESTKALFHLVMERFMGE